jgi:hypothetical protein
LNSFNPINQTSERGMSRPLVVSIPHRLGKPEATRRLKSGLADVQKSVSRLLTVQEEHAIPKQKSCSAYGARKSASCAILTK